MLLGDPHNNKRCVRLDRGVILKPRSCYFEDLFLNPRSLLRGLNSLEEVFRYFPSLGFKLSNSIWCDSEVEFLKLSKVKLSGVPALGNAIGNTIAVSLFFGMTDLHFGNIMYGQCENGRFILGPIDIECLFADIQIPSQTHLFDSKNIPKGYGGLMAIRKELGSASSQLIPSVLRSFIQSWQQLLLAKNEILKIFMTDAYRRSPLRVILKATRSYHMAMETMEMDGVLHEEALQMKRGDIPFFFSYLGKNGLYFLNDLDIETAVKNLDLTKLSTYPNIEILKKPDFSIRNVAPSIAEICYFFRSGKKEEVVEGDISFWDDSIEFGVVINGVRIKCV